MPDDYQQPQDPLPRPSRRRGDPENDSTGHRPVHAPETVEPDSKASLGQFSLLADPTTISGESEGRPGESKSDEINRLRSALYARSREIVALQRDHSTEPEPSPASSTAEEPAASQHAEARLLNSTQARRLAQDAHAREKAIRAELSTARDALHLATPIPRTRSDSPPAPRQGWRTHTLVGSPATSETGLDQSSSQPVSPATAETLLLAEIRELRATLSLARDTTRSQKKKIASLRIQLALSSQDRENGSPIDPTPEALDTVLATALVTSSASESPQRQDDVQRDLARLRDRLRLNDRELEARDAERLLLRQTLEERETQLTARRTQTEALQDRLDAQGRALEQARQQFAQERHRNTEAQDLLDRLRQTLGKSPAEHSSEPDRLEATAPAISEATLVSRLRSDQSGAAMQVFNDAGTHHLDPDEALHADTFGAIRESGLLSRPAIFDAWQDDQIRRHFGPMGIDTIIDLLRAPLARRHDQDRGEMPLLLLGRGAWKWAATLAEGLVRNGTPDFAIYVCDSAQAGMAGVAALGHDRPIRAFLRELPFPAEPETLLASLEEIKPVALISRDFLSTQSDVDPWLDVLASASTAGTCLLFSERTGVGAISAPPELASIGDRIWKLMPERYTRAATSNDERQDPTRIASWREAFAQSQRDSEIVPENNLLARLRSRFRLEMLVRFGFLAEAFVTSPIGENFDPKATRDRKFLSQVADVDDRKIEAGVVPALHLVAVVDCESDTDAPPAETSPSIAQPYED